MEVGLVKRVDIDQEMQQSYLDYAMSVIVARALPDARDGLKPVQRRILYAMHDMSLGPDSGYRKSARIVGEVLGKYHPHGDVAVYEAMARLAQDFTMRYPLVDGQGNFGSIDGDPPAAMRYTEARLTRFATELLSQIDRNTVDFADNFDGTLREPQVLPAAIPNLLVNGANGIAVGMATNIPPHNLCEVVDALAFMLDEWERLDEIGVPDLMRFIKGPDFPTGGILLQNVEEGGLLAAYGSGKGRILIRGKVHAEDLGRGRTRLIITELPYQTNKTSLIERIAELVREGVLESIADLRDESDRQGMRIVIELKQGAEVETTIRTLYQRTPLQSTFGIILLALVDGEPRLLTLKQALRVFLEHRIEVVRRRSEYDLARARHRAHILEGLRVALKNLDEVIQLIRNAPDAEQARTRLMKRFKLSEIQAQAILDMQLRRLASLERKKIEEEYREVTAQIKALESLLGSTRKIRLAVKEELVKIKEQYGDRRRTQIVTLEGEKTIHQFLTADEVAPADKVWVGVTADGKIARTPGEGLPRFPARHCLRASTRAVLILANAQGQASALSVGSLPVVEQWEDGIPLHKASALSEGDRVMYVLALEPDEPKADRYLVTVTRNAMVKKSSLEDLPGPSAQKFTLVKVNPEDELLTGTVTGGQYELLLLTSGGMAIRFSESEVRPMGLVAAGVLGMKLAEGDQVAGLVVNPQDKDILFVCSDGVIGRITGADFPLQGRYGQGVLATRVSHGAEIVGALGVQKQKDIVLHLSPEGFLVLPVSDIHRIKRGDRGTRLKLVSNQEVLALTWMPAVEIPENTEGSSSSSGKPTRRKKTAESEPGPAARAVSPRATNKPSSTGETSPAKASVRKRSSAKAKEEPVKSTSRRRSTVEVEAETTGTTTRSRRSRKTDEEKTPAPAASSRKKVSQSPETGQSATKKSGVQKAEKPAKTAGKKRSAPVPEQRPLPNLEETSKPRRRQKPSDE
ncbi:DNA topoisomerase (ATP-hydrolyzing) subunit A [Anaerolinea thermophila]|uniref:DNA gyrase/topoisomerase IV subunit A n=4 Tax=Anaerolinea TaxID=233189 RepID=UPI0026EFC4CD|nr:DNA topoisomerase (ATP-hydrolyzing) [Anaerolinea thermophila]